MVEAQNQVVTDPAVVGPVQKISTRLFPLADKLRGDVTYKVKVLQSDQVNAFSLPGGWIYVNTAMLTRLGSDQDALAFVIAHEAGHVIFKHGAKQIADAYGKDALVDLLTQGKYQEAANIELQLDLLSHGRDDEYQADRCGIKLMHDAGYNVSGAQHVFALMAHKDDHQADNDWLQTHPVTSTRIKRVEQDIKDTQAPK